MQLHGSALLVPWVGPVGAGPKVQVVLVVAVDEQHLNPGPASGPRDLVGEPVLGPPAEIAELYYHLHTFSGEILDDAHKPPGVGVRVAHQPHPPAFGDGKQLGECRHHRPPLMPCPIEAGPPDQSAVVFRQSGPTSGEPVRRSPSGFSGCSGAVRALWLAALGEGLERGVEDAGPFPSGQALQCAVRGRRVAGHRAPHQKLWIRRQGCEDIG